MKEADVLIALEARHDTEEWAFFPHVPNATGFQGNRIADAIAMNLWPSRGLQIHGFEIKVRRNDWLNELKNPAKSEAVQKYCDRWWIAAAPDIVRDEELPPTWGLMVLRGNKIVVQKDAPTLQAHTIDRAFVAAVLRKAKGYVRSNAVVKAQVDQAYKQGKKDGSQEAVAQVEYKTRDYEALLHKVKEFEAASGIRIQDYWDHGRLGSVVKKLMEDRGHVELIRDIERVQQRCQDTMKFCEQALAELHQA